MADDDTWKIIHAQRAALADDLGALTEAQWHTTSLCSDWTVHEVLAHIVATAKMTPPRFLLAFARSGFRFNTFNARGVSQEIYHDPSETLAQFRAHLDDTTAPPGPIDAMVGESVVHPADIRWPLGIPYTPDPAVSARAASFYVGSNALIGGKKRVEGLSLRATDIGWSTGSGPEVTGAILSLTMAITGRSAALADLSGDGVDILRNRMPRR